MSRSRVMTSGRQVDYGMIMLGIGAAVMGIAAAGLLARGSDRRSHAAELAANRRSRFSTAGARLDEIEDTRAPASPSSVTSGEMEQTRRSGLCAISATVTSARRLNRAAGMLAFGFPAGRFIATATAAGLLGTTAEAGFLHFRGAYHNPFMFIPVTIPPAAALVMAEIAYAKPRNRPFSRWWLRLTALPASAFTPMAFTGTWVDGAIGDRTSSMVPHFRRRQASRVWRSPVSLRSL